jgi:hypothetical protein
MVHHAFGGHGIGLVLRNPPERGVGFDASFPVLNPKIGNHRRRIGGGLREGGNGETERKPEPKQELRYNLHRPSQTAGFDTAWIYKPRSS